MKIKFTYFGLISDALQCSSEEIDVDIDKLKLRFFLEEIHPELKTINYKIAIDAELREDFPKDKTIQEIALLPPFAGG